MIDADFLIASDFNFHMDDLTDGKAIEFNRLLTTFDLQQHVKAQPIFEAIYLIL